MSMTFPRDMAAGVRWRHPSLRLRHRQELSRSANGVIQAKDLGAPLWIGEFASVPLRLAAFEAAAADFDSLQGSVRPFFAVPTHRAYPSSLPSATPVDGLTITVAAIREDNEALTLDGLPAGLVLSAGDFLSIETAVGGREFHRLVRGGTADGTGLSPMLELSPPLRPSVAVDDFAFLANPRVEMRLEPDSLSDRWVSESHRTLSFRAVQVIR